MDFSKGQSVVVQIIKNGYWTGVTKGTFLNVTKNGMLRIDTLSGVRCYKAGNVSARKPKQ